jgi:hypothetical protein
MNARQNATKRFELDFSQAEALLTAYQGARPRYTRYPTAPIWIKKLRSSATSEYGHHPAT